MQSRSATSREDEEGDWDRMTLADFASNFDIVYKPGNRKNVIKLQNKKGFIAKRGSPCVLRYFLRYTNEEEMYRALCILFHPLSLCDASLFHSLVSEGPKRPNIDRYTSLCSSYIRVVRVYEFIDHILALTSPPGRRRNLRKT